MPWYQENGLLPHFQRTGGVQRNKIDIRRSARTRCKQNYGRAGAGKWRMDKHLAGSVEILGQFECGIFWLFVVMIFVSVF